MEVEESFLGRWVRAHIWAPKVGTSGDKKVRIKNIKKKKSKSTLLDVAFHNDSEKKGSHDPRTSEKAGKVTFKKNIFFKNRVLPY